MKQGNKAKSPLDEMLEKFTQLDNLDQGRVLERMDALLENDKYLVRAKIIKQDKNLIFVDFSKVG